MDVNRQHMGLCWLALRSTLSQPAPVHPGHCGMLENLSDGFWTSSWSTSDQSVSTLIEFSARLITSEFVAQGKSRMDCFLTNSLIFFHKFLFLDYTYLGL